MTGWARTALAQRCIEDENWAWGLARWELFDPFSSTEWFRSIDRAHRALYALKAVLCMAMRLRGHFSPDAVLVAVANRKAVPTVEGTDYCWTELTVCRGWRWRTWRYDVRRESAL